MKKHKKNVQKIDDNTNLICDYGCGNKAHFLIGVKKRPCCCNSASKCKAVISKSITAGKETKKRLYGDENWNNPKKCNETNIKKYGNICSLHGKEPAEKTQETWLKKYGVKNRLESPDVQ